MPVERSIHGSGRAGVKFARQIEAAAMLEEAQIDFVC